jgi:hypothetical protein
MEEMHSVERAAELLDMNPESLRRSLRQGSVRGEKRGREWMVPDSEVRRKQEELRHYWAKVTDSGEEAVEYPTVVRRERWGRATAEETLRVVARDPAVLLSLTTAQAKYSTDHICKAIEEGRLSEREYDVQIYPQLVMLHELCHKVVAAWEQRADKGSDVKKHPG